jgi:hypothetical protein
MHLSGTLAPRVRSQVGAGGLEGSKMMAGDTGSSSSSALFVGRIDVVNVTFAYPSRPEACAQNRVFLQ